MDTKTYHDLIPLYISGALDGEELHDFETVLYRSSHELQKALKEWEGTEISLASVSRPVKPPDGLRERVIRRIREAHAAERAMEGPGQARIIHGKGIYSVFPDAMEWQEHPVPGIRFKVLSESKKRGTVTMLMNVSAGARFPEHHHSGEEECYILSGSILLNGRRLGPGVLHLGEENSEHAVLATDEGALLLLVVSKEDYIPPVQ